MIFKLYHPELKERQCAAGYFLTKIKNHVNTHPVTEDIKEEQKQEAERIFAKLIDGWSPAREIFFADVDDVRALLMGGASAKDTNIDNRDGTFTTSLSFKGKTFIYVGVEHVECPPAEA